VERWPGKRAGKAPNLGHRPRQRVTSPDAGHGERDGNCKRDAAKSSQAINLGMGFPT
jgi:hypothetical protein